MAFRPAFIQQISLYKFRFIFGYISLFAVLILVLTLNINTLPNGVSPTGMATVVSSMQMHLHGSLDWVVNAPYHLLQRLSVGIFGLDRLPMVLPSIVFGSITIIVFFLTMRQWFSETVAVVTTLTAVTTGPFITMVRSATPDIMLPFWTILLLYAAVQVLVKQDRSFIWKFTVMIASIGLLYTPFGIYPLLAFLIGGIFHPHVRSRIRRIRTYRKLILLGVALLGILPLTFYLVWHPTGLETLTGLDQFRVFFADPAAMLRTLYISFINFTYSGFVGIYVVPAFSIASLCLILLGLFRSIQDHHTTRSYIILTWCIIILPIVILAPGAQQVVLIPALLLLAIGSETLILDWYKLFPRNPYARIAGLIPLTILFVTIAVSNIAQYFYNNQYIGNPIYQNSLSSIRKVLTTSEKKPILLITDASTVTFYSLLNREFTNLSVSDEIPPKLTAKTMVMPQVKKSFGTPKIILTSDRSEDSVTLRVYTP